MTVTESTYAVKTGLEAAIAATVAGLDDGDQWVTFWGAPPPTYPRQLMSLLNVIADVEAATMGTNRTREETIRVEVHVVVFRQGSMAQKDSADAAYAALAALERHIRVDDPTLGGACRVCLLTHLEETGDTDPTDRASGRYTEIFAEFTARVRITE